MYFLHYEMTVIPFEVVKDYRDLSLAWFEFEFVVAGFMRCAFVYTCEVTVGFYFVSGYFFVHRSNIGWLDCSLIGFLFRYDWWFLGGRRCSWCCWLRILSGTGMLRWRFYLWRLQVPQLGRCIWQLDSQIHMLRVCWWFLICRRPYPFWAWLCFRSRWHMGQALGFDSFWIWCGCLRLACLFA